MNLYDCDLKDIKDIKQVSTTVLAFMGDAVYEEYVRKYLVSKNLSKVKDLHGLCVKYVKASSQAYAINNMMNYLTEEEVKLVKRGRNKKVATKAKNASMSTYKWATAFEALVGYLYLVKDEARLKEIIYKAMEVIDESSR